LSLTMSIIEYIYDYMTLFMSYVCVL